MMLKALALVYGLVVERANDDLCQKNVKNAGLISAKPIDFQLIFPENNHKIGCFFTNCTCFSAKFAPKIPFKIGRYQLREFVPNNPAKFDFFPRPVRSPKQYGAIHQILKYHGQK